MATMRSFINPDVNIDVLSINLIRTLPITDKVNLKKIRALAREKNPEECFLLTKSLKETTAITERNKINYMALLSIMLSRGCFRSALILRELLSCYYKDSFDGLSIEGKLSSLAFSIEDCNEYDFFDKIKKIKDKVGEAQLEKTEFLFSLVTGENDYSKIKVTAADSDFFHDIKGSSVALVTPTPSEIKNGLEIDSHDLVARINARKLIEYECFDYIGSKQDISYYNVQSIIEEVEDTGLFTPPDNIRHACFKGLIPVKNGAKSRSFIRFDNALAYGTPNMLPNALFDILAFQPNKVKIFNSDLMLTLKRTKDYYKGRYEYLAEKEKMKLAFNRSTLSHDPFSAFSIIKKLSINNPVFEVDRRLGQILDLSSLNYAEKLESVYGPNSE